jgi:hypothetical protein
MPLTDPYAELRHTSLSEPSGAFVALATETDVAETRGLYVGTGGDLVCKNEAGASVTFKNVASGTTLPIRTTRVVAAGTTAADLVALY